MPYLLLIIGLLVGFYGLYRFFLSANVAQIRALFMTGALLALCVAIFYLAITGRLPAAAALLPAALPPLLVLFKQHRHHKETAGKKHDAGTMTRAEALEILGLEEDADPQAVKEAYKKLMQKVHPDHEGSDWMAAKLNQARDILLQNSRS